MISHRTLRKKYVGHISWGGGSSIFGGVNKKTQVWIKGPLALCMWPQQCRSCLLMASFHCTQVALYHLGGTDSTSCSPPFWLDDSWVGETTHLTLPMWSWSFIILQYHWSKPWGSGSCTVAENKELCSNSDQTETIFIRKVKGTW